MKIIIPIIVILLISNRHFTQKSVSGLFNYSPSNHIIEFEFKNKVSDYLNFILSCQLGHYGKNETSTTTREIPYVGKYNVLNYLNSNEYYVSYKSSFKGAGLGIKIENNWKLDEKKKFIFLGLGIAYHYIIDDYYINFTDKHYFSQVVTRTENIIVKHSSISAGLYLGYRYKVNRKIGIEARVNFPYYIPIQTSYYKIRGVDYKTIGLEPNLSLGINYIIKK